MRVEGNADHLVRVGGLAAAAVVAFLLLRAALIPEDFGRLGHYRAGALDDARNRPLVHAGRAACTPCHAAPAQQVAGGAHQTIGCESCHGPLARHAEKPKEQKAARPEARPLCVNCHARNVARPAAFPQVDVTDHAGDATCTDCHAAHAPGN
ncbi:MAG TPA: multiheme c-type cytochrome [Vicinamibacteria bacterium]|nr:multiheme c-type cytochrome [Vicinamibacteria bacterium]